MQEPGLEDAALLMNRAKQLLYISGDDYRIIGV